MKNFHFMILYLCLSSTFYALKSSLSYEYNTKSKQNYVDRRVEKILLILISHLIKNVTMNELSKGSVVGLNEAILDEIPKLIIYKMKSESFY